MRNQFGEGSTPALYGNTLVVVWDHLNGDGPSSSRSTSATGKELWRVARDEIDTWATPLVLEVERPAAGDRAGDAPRSAATTSRPARVVWEARRPDDEPDSVAGV